MIDSLWPDPYEPIPASLPTPIPRNLPAPDLKFVSLKFFESGIDTPQKELRFYNMWFPKEKTRYIHYELTVRNQLYKERDQKLQVIVRYYNPDGSHRATNLPYDWIIKSETEETWLTGGRGSDKPGTWDHGDYRMVIFINGMEFAEGSFTSSFK